MSNGFRPTLLVGIGGTGCRIVEAVYTEARERRTDDAGKIVVLAFDTDENDLRRLRGLERRQQIRFSTPQPVYTILRANPEVQDWFVREELLPAELRNMTLLDGAGQIRMLSRLALHVALKDPQARLDIERAIAQLAVHDNRELFEGAINVLLVGSLAGATGSGAFLQLALLLDQLARERGMRAEVRGLFLLPDVYIRAGSLPTQQIGNVRANAYASLRELFAVTALATGRGGVRPFDFEYAPGQRPRRDALPMKSVTFIDYENGKGGNLGPNLAHYTRMAVRAAYTQIFTPIGTKVASVSINDVRAKLAAAAREGAELYAGVGVGAVTYPAEDLHRYLSLRFARENLSGDWLTLDRMFRLHLRRFQEAREAGDLTARPPDPGESYLEGLDQLATRERRLFFREIHGRLHPRIEDERGETVRPLHTTYLDAFEAQLRQAFWAAPERIVQIVERKPVDSKQLDDREALVDGVRKLELILDRDWRVLEEAVRERPDDLFISLWNASDGLGEAEWQPHHLQSWIIKGGPHLVQVRYFLYALRREIAARRRALDPKGVGERLFNLARQFDDDKPATSRGTPRVLEEARAASEAGLIGRLIGRRFEEFQGKFVVYYNRSLQLMREWADVRLRERLYDVLGQEIDLLIKTLEELFLGLERLQETLAAEIAELTGAHTATGGVYDGNYFLYADPASKEDLWQRFHEAAGGLRQGEAANATLTRAVYQRYREQRLSRRAPRPGENDIVGLFRRAIVDEFAHRTVGADFGPFFDMTVVEAAKREADLKGLDWRRHLRSAVELVGGQAEPFLDLAEAGAGQRIMFWAVAPAVQEEYGDQRSFDELFTYNQGEAPLILPEFSPRELLCLNCRVNLDLRDLKKLHPGDPTDDNVNAPAQGSYFRAYDEVVSALLAAELKGGGVLPAEFTPHLHRDWHKPGVLPEMFPHRQQAFEAGLLRGFVTAAASGALAKGEEYGRQVTALDLSTTAHGRFPLSGGPDGHDDWRVLEALEQRPELLPAIERHWQDLVARSPRATSLTFDEQPLAGALTDPDLMARLLGIAITRQDEARRDRRVEGLLSAQFALIRELVERDCADLAAIGRRDRTLDLVGGTGEAALAALARRPLRTETLAILRTLFNQALARFARRLEAGTADA